MSRCALTAKASGEYISLVVHLHDDNRGEEDLEDGMIQRGECLVYTTIMLTRSIIVLIIEWNANTYFFVKGNEGLAVLVW